MKIFVHFPQATMPVKPVFEELPDGTTLVSCCFDKRINYSRIANTMAPLRAKFRGFEVALFSHKISALAESYGGTRVWIRIVNRKAELNSVFCFLSCSMWKMACSPNDMVEFEVCHFRCKSFCIAYA